MAWPFRSPPSRPRRERERLAGLLRQPDAVTQAAQRGRGGCAAPYSGACGSTRRPGRRSPAAGAPRRDGRLQGRQQVPGQQQRHTVRAEEKRQQQGSPASASPAAPAARQQQAGQGEQQGAGGRQHQGGEQGLQSRGSTAVAPAAAMACMAAHRKRRPPRANSVSHYIHRLWRERHERPANHRAGRRLLLVHRGGVQGSARRHRRRVRLQQRRDRASQLRGRVHRPHRAQRGGEGHLRPRQVSTARSAGDLLRHPRPDADEPPGQRRRHPVPQRHLLHDARTEAGGRGPGIRPSCRRSCSRGRS